MKNLTKKLILGLLLSLFFTLPSLGQPNETKGYNMIKHNSILTPFTLHDQFGKEHNLSQFPKLLICSFGKESGKLISNYFNNQNNNYLTNHEIKLIADVSSVPSLLRSAFILPKMKRYNFKILLSDDADFSKQFPREDDSLTILKIDNNVVTSISFVKDEATLKTSIEG